LDVPAGAGTAQVLDESGSAIAYGDRDCPVVDRERFGWAVQAGASYEVRWPVTAGWH
jgi:hypothetical protein